MDHSKRESKKPGASELDDTIFGQSLDGDDTQRDHEQHMLKKFKEPEEEEGVDTKKMADSDAAESKKLSKALEEIAQLTEQLLQAESKVKEHWDLVLHGRADMENARRRNQRDMENARKFAIKDFVLDLLMVVDSLEQGLLVNLDDNSPQAAKSLRQGMELTLKLLVGTLEKFAVKQLNPEGMAFDPSLHQAIQTQETEDYPEGAVVSVIQKGYQLHDQILRPARVIIAKPPKKS